MYKFVLFDIDHTLFDTERFRASNLTEFYLYEEVLDTLKSISKIAKLGIFSKGELEFQKTKLKNTGINEFFEDQNIHVFEDKILNVKVLHKYASYKTFFVDDRLDVLQTVKNVLPSIFTIWIKQGPHAKETSQIKDFTPDKTILSLRELTELVANS